MNGLNGIIIDGKVYEAVLDDTDSCDECTFVDNKIGCCRKSYCVSFIPSYGKSPYIFRFSQTLTDKLNGNGIQ